MGLSHNETSLCKFNLQHGPDILSIPPSRTSILKKLFPLVLPVVRLSDRILAQPHLDELRPGHFPKPSKWWAKGPRPESPTYTLKHAHLYSERPKCPLTCPERPPAEPLLPVSGRRQHAAQVFGLGVMQGPLPT